MDGWIGVFMMEPFSVSSPMTILNCTDDELWKWYYRPAKRRSDSIENKHKHGGDVFAPETKEEVDQAMNMLKMIFPQRTEG